MNRIRVVLADDQTLIREGLQVLLRTVDEFEIVGEAANGEDAIRLAHDLKPCVVLVDQDMPGTDGLEATRLIKATIPQVEVVVMADRLDHAKAIEAIEAGATGYILKDIPAANLMAALRSVCNGRAFFHPEIARRMAERLIILTRHGRSRDRPEVGSLTPRELEILVEIAKGRTDSEIAAEFVLSEFTVKTHVSHILRKLGCRNRTEAVVHVIRKGFIK